MACDKPTSLSCLLFVAHPDDDAIFAGALQQRARRHDWTVVCLTHVPASPRAAEMRQWQSLLGTDPHRIHFLGLPDDPEDRRRGRCSLDQGLVEAALRSLSVEPDIVVTHNELGEYGHPHHLLVHRAAHAVFPGRPFLHFGHGLEAADSGPTLVLPCADKWPDIAACYASQAHVVESLRRPAETFFFRPPTSGQTASTLLENLL